MTHVISAGIGIAAWKIIEHQRDKRDYPYSWKCDLDKDCDFDAAANDVAYLDEKIMEHKREDHDLDV